MYCSKCGAQIEDSAAFCKACGAPTMNTPSVNTPSVNVMKYVGFWKRLVAYLIDFVILSIIMVCIGFVTGFMAGAMIIATDSQSIYDPTINLLSCLMYPISFVLIVLYFSFFESSQSQATPGKMVLNIIVVDKNGSRISFGKAIVRAVGRIISGVLLGLGFLAIAFSDTKQGLHDMFAGTYVVEKGSVSQSQINNPPMNQ